MTTQHHSQLSEPVRSALREGDSQRVRQVVHSPSFNVDAETGVISGAAILSVGRATGHPFANDMQTLTAIRDLMAAEPDGVISRFHHRPDVDGKVTEKLGTTVAIVKNPRIEGDVLRGDVYVGAYAATTPGLGDVRSYLLNLAKEAPTKLGLSIDFYHGIERVGDVAYARPVQLNSIDFVERPAANPRGLLSAQTTDPGASPAVSPTPTGGPAMDELMKLLVSLGLAPAATQDQAKTFYMALPDDKKKSVLAAYPDVESKLSAASPPATPPANTTPATDKPAASQMSAGPVTPPANSAPSTTATHSVLAAEQARVAGIREVAKTYGLDEDFVRSQLAANNSIEQSITAARTALTTNTQPYPVSVRTTDRSIEQLGEGFRDSLLIRSGLKVEKPSERAREFEGMTLIERNRAYLNKIGIDTTGLSRTALAQLPFDRGRLAALGRSQLAHSPGDFSFILNDTIGKTLRAGYEEAPVTWTQWARRDTAPDFKPITRVQLSEAGNLPRVRRGGEYPETSFRDSGESYILQKYGYIVSVNWETIINDDMSALTRIPQATGRAARRLENDLVYFVLLANATMSDGGALFNSTAQGYNTDGSPTAGHANLAAGTGQVGAPTVALLNRGVRALTLMKGLANATVGVPPQFLIVPPSLSGTAWELLNSTTNPASNNANVRNRFAAGGQRSLTLIEEAALENGVALRDEEGSVIATANGSATAWYLAAANSAIDTIEISFLESEPAPVVTEQDSFRTDGRQFKIRHTCAAAAIDYRGLFRNPGV